MKLKSFIKFSALLFISIFPSIVLIEVGYKLIPESISIFGKAGAKQYTFDDITGYSLRRNISDQVLGVNTDRFGNRITARNYDKNKKSILFVGDSTVFGWGVRDKDSYVYLLSESPKFNCLNFINLGVPSYSLGNIKEVIKNKSLQYDPSIILTSITWPWKAFESDFYGPNPSEDWKKVDVSFFKKNIISRDGYKRRYIFGQNTLYLMKYLGSHLKKTLWPIIKTSLQENKVPLMNEENKKRYIIRPALRDFDITSDEEIKYARDHFSELKNAEKSLKNKTNQQIKFIYFMHPYYYTINNPKYYSLGKIGYEYLVNNLQAIDTKSELIENYLSDKKLRDIYFDASHLTTEGNMIWSEIIEKRLSYVLQDLNISCKN